MLQVLNESSLARHQESNNVLLFTIKIDTGVPTIVSNWAYPLALIEQGLAGSQVILTQAAIDSLLGSTNEFVASTALDSVSMAADDTLAFVVNCGGQIKSVDAVEVVTTVGSVVGFGQSTALASGAFTGAEVQYSTAGNIFCRVTLTDITAAATSGYAVVKIFVKLK